MTLRRVENNQQRRLVDFSLTRQDINQGRTRHSSDLSDSAKMAHQKKQFPAFQSVQKYSLDALLRLHDDDGDDCDSATSSTTEGEEQEKEDSGRSVHFLFKVPRRRYAASLKGG